MKKILLSTTALVMTAGVASAEITLSGSGSTGVARNGSATSVAGDMETYAEVNITAVASAETDSGLGMAMSMSIDAGTGYTFGDGDDFDGAKTNGVGLDDITITGGFGTLKIDASNSAPGGGSLDHLVGEESEGDIQFTTAITGMDINLVMDLSADVDDVGTTKSQDVAWSASIATSLGAADLTVAADEEGGYLAKLGWDLGNGLTVSVDTKETAATADDTSATAALNEVANGLDITYVTGDITLTANYDSIEDNDQFGYSVAYDMGTMDIKYSSDEDNDWSATMSYDLGGATLAAGANYSKDAYLGVSFSF